MRAGRRPLSFASASATNTSSAGKAQRAADHLARAVELDPKYSAAWKGLGKALADAGRKSDALAAYRQGIAVAEAKGDKQAAKEMTVFARRLEQELEPGE